MAEKRQKENSFIRVVREAKANYEKAIQEGGNPAREGYKAYELLLINIGRAPSEGAAFAAIEYEIQSSRVEDWRELVEFVAMIASGYHGYQDRLREESLERQSKYNEANEIILYAVQNKDILDKEDLAAIYSELERLNVPGALSRFCTFLNYQKQEKSDDYDNGKDDDYGIIL